MKLYHATPIKNLESILKSGLLVSKCAKSSKIKGIWLHTKSKRLWAVLHTETRHGYFAKNIVILEINIPSRFLKRYKKGLYHTIVGVNVILPGAIVRYMTSSELFK